MTATAEGGVSTWAAELPEPMAATAQNARSNGDKEPAASGRIPSGNAVAHRRLARIGDNPRRMALSHTILNVAIDVANVDRSVYESFTLKVAQHPSESDDFLIGRLLAYCLEFREGIEFSRGVSSTEEPAIMVRDLTGQVTDWIEMGTPAADRLHKASKATKRVAVYFHRPPGPYLGQLAGERVHRLEAIEFYQLDRSLVTDLTAKLDRRMKMEISVNEGHLFVTLNGHVHEGGVEACTAG